LTLEGQLNGCVIRQQWEALHNDHNNLQQKLETITIENGKTKRDYAALESHKKKLMEEMEILKKESMEKQEEVSKLEAYQNFWRNRANSIQEELQKILTQTNPSGSKITINGNHPHVQKQLEKKRIRKRS